MPGNCVAVIGVGRLGSAIAERYASEGFNVVVWNRTPLRAREVASRINADIAESPADAAESCRYVHIAVADNEASTAVIMGRSGIATIDLSGNIVYNHSTVTPRHTLSALDAVRKAGGVYVEAPIIGGPSTVRAGRALVLCGGSPEVCDHLHLLGEVVYMGEVPKATAAKLAFNIAFLAVVGGLAEAASLAAAYGVPFEEFADKILSRTWLKTIVERYGERFKLGGPASFTAKLAGKDARYAMEALHDKGLPGYMAAAVASYYALMDGEGYGAEDYPSLVGFMEKKAKGSGRV